ncbi:MAG TPA: VanW family protein, partial [Chloroflexota bacterium]|nr:VanW family protein [Chloroflexota bacterium]
MTTPAFDSVRTVLTSPSRFIGANAIVAVLGLIVLLVGYQVAFAGRIFPGVQVMGVDLGGQTPEQAQRSLTEVLDSFDSRPIELRFQELEWQRRGGEFGLKRDVTPLIESAFNLGRDGNLLSQLVQQLSLWRSGRNLDSAGVLYDASSGRAFVEGLAGEVNRPVTDARLDIRPDGSIDQQSAQMGRELDVDATWRRLNEALSHPGPQTVELVVNQVSPRITDDMIADASNRAAQVLGSPLTLRFQDKQWQLDSRALVKTLKVNTAPDGRVSIEADKSAIEKLTEQIAAEIDQEPQNARFSWAGGALDVLRESKDGQKLERPKTVELLASQLMAAERVLPLPVSVAPAEVRVDDKAKMGISTLIESSRTNFASGLPPKKHNISLAASRLNGVVVPPGGLFSFNKEVGSTSLDAGYQVGWGIAASGASGHQTVPSVAGGICQVATTLFQSVFWSGYQIEERNWHLYWIPSYTSRNVVGLDATVDEDSGLDFKFLNTTENYILIQSWIDASYNVNFALYGTPPPWTVKIESLPKTDVVDPETGTLIQEEPTLPKGQRIAVEGAQAGFTSTIVRHVIPTEGEERTLRMTSRYKPARNVIMVGTGGAPASAPRTEVANAPASAVVSGTTAQAQPTARPAQPTAVPNSGAPKPTAAPAPAAQPTAAAKTAAPTSAPTVAPAKPTAAVANPTPVPAKPTAAQQAQPSATS